MADFATEPDGKARLAQRMRRNGATHDLRDREIASAVGQLDHLLQQSVGRIERRMHVPERAGAAEFGKRKRAGGKTLRYVAGIVNAQEEEGNAARIRPLQRGE